MPSKYDMAAKAREIVLSVRSTGDDATRICDGLIANNLGVISERVAAVVEAAIAWADAEYDEDYVEEQTLLRRVNYLRKLEGESDG